MDRSGEWYVYVLRSDQDGKLYIGISKNVDARLKRHNGGFVVSTKHRRPFQLVGIKQVGSLIVAREMELELKAFKDPHRVCQRIGYP